MFSQDIIQQIRTTEYGTRSYALTVFKAIEEADAIEDIAEAVINTVALGAINADPLLAVARKTSTQIHRILHLELPNDNSLLRFGTIALDWMAQADLIDVEKYLVLDDKEKAKEQWFVKSISQDLTNYAMSISPSRSMVSPTEGVRHWTKPRYLVDNHIIPIVKKADRYEMLDLYTYQQMPDVYNCLNSLNAQGFRINQSLQHLIITAPPHSFIPAVVSEEERKEALRTMNDISRKARYVEEVRFHEMNKWLLEEADVEEVLANKISKQQATEKAQDYYDTKIEPWQKVISNWSKRMDFDKICRLSSEWGNSVINYLFNLDTRGRIYAVQNYLTPLGSDVAKALLIFDGSYQVSGYDLCISLANCFGQDKLSFEQRIEWVNENSAKLYDIGDDAWANWDLIIELGLDGEEKTRWQGLAHCIEYKEYIDYVDTHGTEEGFTTSLVIGLDATASGTQILTMLGRDDRVAPFVNVSQSPTGQVGDFYTYLAKFLKPKLKATLGTSASIDALINNFDKYGRKLAKRNSMTFSYSGTKFGFGQQHWEDRHSYNKGNGDTTGSDLTRHDCRQIGNLMYEVCVENIRGGAEVMEWLRDGINYINDGAVVSWTMPDGFIAFQVADESKRKSLDCIIGSRKVCLQYYTYQDKPKKSEHKNGIAPNWVHSYDSYLLRLIVNGMPDEAPISTVHDQFSTCSYYVQELQETAKEAYKTIADRTVAESICEEAFGIHRPLPLVGTWDTTEIDKAEFIIC